MNGRSSNVTAIDAKTNKIIATIKLDGKPEFAVPDTKGLLFINIENKSEIVELNTKTFEVIKKWSVAPGVSPSGLAIDIKNNILFSGCDNNMMTISNAEKGKVITTVPIGGRVDACAFDPKTGLAFSSNGEGSLTVIKEVSPKEFKVVDNISTIKGLRTMALNPKNHDVYLVGNLDGKRDSDEFGILVLKRK